MPTPPSHNIPLVLDQLDVPHNDCITCTVAVTSLVPKLTPLSVTLAPPELAMFTTSVCVTTGAAKADTESLHNCI